jgi:hypothetical protein
MRRWKAKVQMDMFIEMGLRMGRTFHTTNQSYVKHTPRLTFSNFRQKYPSPAPHRAHTKPKSDADIIPRPLVDRHPSLSGTDTHHTPTYPVCVSSHLTQRHSHPKPLSLHAVLSPAAPVSTPLQSCTMAGRKKRQTANVDETDETITKKPRKEEANQPRQGRIAEILDALLHDPDPDDVNQQRVETLKHLYQ